MAFISRMRSISSEEKPASVKMSSVCSPKSGAMTGSTLVSPSTKSGVSTTRSAPPFGSVLSKRPAGSELLIRQDVVDLVRLAKCEPARVQRIAHLICGQLSKDNVQFGDQRMRILRPQLGRHKSRVLRNLRAAERRRELGETRLSGNHDQMKPAAILRLIKIVDGAQRFLTARAMSDFARRTVWIESAFPQAPFAISEVETRPPFPVDIRR